MCKYLTNLETHRGRLQSQLYDDSKTMMKVIALAVLSILSFIPLGLVMDDFQIALFTALALVLPLVMYLVMSPKRWVVLFLFAVSLTITWATLEVGDYSPVITALIAGGVHLLVVTLPFQFNKILAKVSVDPDMLIYGSLTALLSTAAGFFVLFLR